VYLHGLRDPGNVGTIIRSAHAFGASCVALGPGCADPYGPKAVRASMGAIFTVPLAHAGALEELPGERLALSAGAGEELRGPARQIAPALTLLVGSERAGLPPEVLDACPRQARITIAGDSLNAAMATTVALYELTRKPSRVRAS
jgi:TrmH family RNA methyltransferase